MEELIDINNRLHDVFSMSGLLDFHLPQIVVVGAQSSGKSSVLENLVGRSFLPRGIGIVTRCPLELRLVNIKEKATACDYAIFQHKKTEVFRDYQEITKEIEELTEQLAGGAKGICSTPICLTMYSKTFTNLTLVDLPGLTKVPVGDQPEDIEQQTRELILKYIENPNSVILAVVPANADMATCESLKIARKVDPEGVRTLAVVTKLDIMDEGTDAMDMLSGNIIPVKLGIIGVINRSQKGILENKSMKQCLKDEEAFFKKHYKGLKSIHGTPYLVKTIQNILINKIKSILPDLKLKIIKKLQDKGTELHKLEKLNSDCPNLLLEFILKFTNNFCDIINGKLGISDTKQLNGGANIYKAFRDTEIILEKFKPLTGVAKEEVLLAVQNAHGINITCYTPKEPFERLVKNEIKLLHSPCTDCVDVVHKEVIKIISHCIDDPEMHLQVYPQLKQELSFKALDLLNHHLAVTNEMVENIIKIHLAYINYGHPEFLASRRQHLSLESEKTSPGVSTANSDDDCVYEDTVKTIESYFCVVKKSVKDMLPKLITRFLINEFMEGLHSNLMTQLCSSENSELLQQSSDFLLYKNELTKEVSVLEEANDILNNLDSFHQRSSRSSTDNLSQDIPTSPEIPTSKEMPLFEEISSPKYQIAGILKKILNYMTQGITMPFNNEDVYVAFKLIVLAIVVVVVAYISYQTW